MAEIIQNVLYLTTPELFVERDHLTLRIELQRVHKLSLPIHHVESICLFGPGISLTSGALQLCQEHGVAVNYLSENGYFQARLSAIPDTSVTLRRAHFRAADNLGLSIQIAQAMIQGKLHNCRNSLLRAARETENPADQDSLTRAADAHAHLLKQVPIAETHEALRGLEGTAAREYFSTFTGLLKQQRDTFAFGERSRRPPRDRINCLLSFLYALVRHDCMAALTSIGLDPFVGFLHVERANRPALALDLMEEFRPWLADRLAVSLINRQQVQADDFHLREGGAVELKDTTRKTVLKAYQERKRETMQHPALDQQITIGKAPFIQARILARTIRGDLPAYLPLTPK